MAIDTQRFFSSRMVECGPALYIVVKSRLAYCTPKEGGMSKLSNGSFLAYAGIPTATSHRSIGWIKHHIVATVIGLVLCLTTGITALANPPVGMEEKKADSFAVLVGTWKGRIHVGPFANHSAEVRVNADGSWTNTVENAGQFRGNAWMNDGTIRAKSATTNVSYIWRLYEATDRNEKKRVLHWLVEGNLVHVSTLEAVENR